MNSSLSEIDPDPALCLVSLGEGLTLVQNSRVLVPLHKDVELKKSLQGKNAHNNFKKKTQLKCNSCTHIGHKKREYPKLKKRNQLSRKNDLPIAKKPKRKQSDRDKRQVKAMAVE